MIGFQKKYDLEERTALLGEAIIEFVKKLQKDHINNELVSQIIRSGTSIGANCMEADGAVTKKDFRYRIGLCRKEAKETRYWLRMIAKANPNLKTACQQLRQEAHELTLIFSAILSPKRNE